MRACAVQFWSNKEKERAGVGGGWGTPHLLSSWTKYEKLMCVLCREPRGFAFVQFVDPYDASEAQHHMNRQLFCGREIDHFSESIISCFQKLKLYWYLNSPRQLHQLLLLFRWMKSLHKHRKMPPFSVITHNFLILLFCSCMFMYLRLCRASMSTTDLDRMTTEYVSRLYYQSHSLLL